MQDTVESARPRLIVGIGASAGGLDPIERFFDNLPADTGMAFVIVQHLSPDFKSLMDELLARHTDMPIHLVEDGMQVLPNRVYLIPSRKEMIISGGRLLLSERSMQKELTLPIDVFFRSLAQDCGPRAVAIVLSGGGSDGSRGIRDIREAGGLVIVQDTASAQFDGMPKTARDAGVAQWVLAPREMPGVLLEHAKDPASRHHSARAATPQGLTAVYGMLQQEYGLDFTQYKPSTITRRIDRRIALASTPNIDEYVARLRRDRGELDVLYRDLLIGVTRFFRDEKAFELLEQRVLPDLVQRASDDAPLRIWVPGCATGEEAFSIAIVVSDLLGRLGERPVKIFASDVHRGSIERAARAVYPPEAVAKVSPERLDRYFVRTGGDYQIVPDLRQLVVFAAHDVIKDAPFTRVDLISCRNLLIYFQASVQLKVLSLFHFALTRGGVLVLGPSESPGSLAKDFETIDAHWKVYRKHTDARMPVDLGQRRQVYDEARTAPATVVVQQPKLSLSRLIGTYDAVLGEVMPPSLLVSEHGEVVHAFGGASRFLKPRDGRLGVDVLDLVQGELRTVLSGSLKAALADPSPLVFSGIRVEENGRTETYEVTLRRIPGREGAGPHVLVSFEPHDASLAPARRERRVDLDEASRHRLADLGAELTQTKESLQAAIEELQSTNEELQASNEELQASNEELQSTNEELQSVNEELYTVNAEYQRKIGELTQLTNDMDNLLSSTEIGTIFLDRDLTIRKFTPHVAETFKLVAHDVGRPIATFAHELDYPDLLDDLRRVATSGEPLEKEIRSFPGKTFFLRVLPYRVRGRNEGIVLALVDVSSLRAAEDALFHERHLLENLLAGVPDAIYFKDAKGTFIRTNRAMATRLGLDDPRAAVGKTAEQMPARELALALDAGDQEILRTGQIQSYHLEKREGDEGQPTWDLTTRLPIRDPSGHVVGVIVISRNVTDQKRSEQKAQEAVDRRDQFLAMLSHELRNPLGALVSATALLQRTEVGHIPSARRPLEVMLRQSHQMTRLLDDLLEVSRVTRNKIELRKQRIDLALLARETLDTLREPIQAARLDLALEANPGACWVRADPARIQQVLSNLVGNAIKYTPAGGRVAVAVEPDGAEVVVRVRDTGAGIPKGMLDSVFDLFVQATRTLDRAAGGIGVGLTLVRTLVTMHGGTVTASSDGEGAGAEFVVRLPLETAESNVDSAPVTPSPPSRPSLPAGAKIVVVEDNEDSREMLSEILALAGYECHTAASGVAGLAVIDEVRPGVAIIDIGLPEVDGFDVARRLRADPRHSGIWLMALTGYGQSADRLATRDAGFDAHVVKPVQLDRLLRCLEEMHAPRAAAAVAE